MRKIIARFAIGLCLFIGLFTGTPRATADTLPHHGVILLYHHVAENTPPITSISPDDFASQMRYLEHNNFTVWPLPKLVNSLNHNQAIPDKTVAITFDDNYRSVYTAAYPRLKQRGWPFTVFVSTDAVDRNINMQATWEQLREMAKHGATIANHSATHAHLLQRLPGESQQQWRERVAGDIQKAQRRIKAETGQEHNLFAYPYGETNRELAQLVGELGYVGIGQHSGPAGHDYPGDSLPRFPFAGRFSDLDDFALKVLTLPLPVTTVSTPDALLDEDNHSPVMTLQMSPLQRSLKGLQCYGSGQGKLLLKWLSNTTVEVSPNKELPPGRSRYNCTLASDDIDSGTRRFYWYSQPWIRPDDKGTLLD